MTVWIIVYKYNTIPLYNTVQLYSLYANSTYLYKPSCFNAVKANKTAQPYSECVCVFFFESRPVIITNNYHYFYPSTTFTLSRPTINTTITITQLTIGRAIVCCWTKTNKNPPLQIRIHCRAMMNLRHQVPAPSKRSYQKRPPRRAQRYLLSLLPSSIRRPRPQRPRRRRRRSQHFQQ